VVAVRDEELSVLGRRAFLLFQGVSSRGDSLGQLFGGGLADTGPGRPLGREVFNASAQPTNAPVLGSRYCERNVVLCSQTIHKIYPTAKLAPPAMLRYQLF
jgi:hypothetical protein